MERCEEIPDEILEKILILASGWIEDSINISQVCQRWRNFMKYRFSLVKFLIHGDETSIPWVDLSGQFIMYKPIHLSFEAQRRYLNFLPNLIVFQAAYFNPSHEKEFIEMINSKPSVKCLSMDLGLDKFISKTSVSFDNIEMISFEEDIRASRLKQFSYFNESITQFYGIWHQESDNDDYAAKCPRLKRVHIHDFEYYLLADGVSPLSPRGEEHQLDKEYTLANLSSFRSETVEILEMNVFYAIGILRAFDLFIGNYPNVRSLFIKFQSILQVSDAVKWYNTYGTCRLIGEKIEDIVIEINLSWKKEWPPETLNRDHLIQAFPAFENHRILEDVHEGVPYSLLEETPGLSESNFWYLFHHYPNLRHLAVRYWKLTSAEEICKELRFARNLQYLEICESNSPDLPEEDRFISTIDPEDIISQYFKIHGRIIECKVITKEFEETSPFDKMVGKASDFMETVFPRDFDEIPHFLIDE